MPDLSSGFRLFQHFSLLVLKSRTTPKTTQLTVTVTVNVETNPPHKKKTKKLCQGVDTYQVVTTQVTVELPYYEPY